VIDTFVASRSKSEDAPVERPGLFVGLGEISGPVICHGRLRLTEDYARLDEHEKRKAAKKFPTLR